MQFEQDRKITILKVLNFSDGGKNSEHETSSLKNSHTMNR